MNNHRERLHSGHHLPPAQQVKAESAGDGDEPGQKRALRIEPLEVDEGPDERVLCEVLGVSGPKHPPAEPIDRAVKAKHECVEGPRIAAAGAARKVTLCLLIVCVRTLVSRIASLYERSLLAVRQESTGEA